MKLTEIKKSALNRQEIIDWLMSQGIVEYRLGPNNIVDVEEDAHLTGDIKEIPVKFGYVKGYFAASNCRLTSFKGCPDSVSKNFFFDGNKIQSFEGIPSKFGRDVSLENCGITSLEGIHNYINEMFGGLDVRDNNIKSHCLGVLLIKGCQYFSSDNQKVDDILNKYLSRSDPSNYLFDCQAELIDNGLEEFAQL